MVVIRNQRCHIQLLGNVLTQSGESCATIQAHPKQPGSPLGTTQLSAQMLSFLRIGTKCVGQAAPAQERMRLLTPVFNFGHWSMR
jgi:hypothetical protein